MAQTGMKDEGKVMRSDYQTCSSMRLRTGSLEFSQL